MSTQPEPHEGENTESGFDSQADDSNRDGISDVFQSDSNRDRPAPEPAPEHDAVEESQTSDRSDPIALAAEPTAALASPEPVDDEHRDQEATLSDLESDESVLSDPRPEPTEMTITLSGGQLSTDLESGESPAEALTSVGELSDVDIQRLSRILIEEQSRRGVAQPRPFQHLDFESLALLYNQVRTELGNR